MSDSHPLVLHHYTLSPFSEKVRLLLGYCGLAWHSVQVAPRLPRPDLMQLTGGYRRIPVLQCGADIYCDTRLIARELAARGNRMALYADEDTAVAERAAWADSRLFFAALTASVSRRTLPHLRRAADLSLLETVRLIVDRVGMLRGARVPKMSGAQARRMLQAALDELEAALIQDFLFGDEPRIADFSVYHSLHFAHERARSGLLDPYPRLLAWMARMAAFGHGRSEEISAQQARDMARQAQPAALPHEGPGDDALDPFKAGDAVAIRPDDYGVMATEGVLVGATAHAWVLRRDTDGLGSLHVHFPRDGFVLQGR